jgi:hypothetical protein
MGFSIVYWKTGKQGKQGKQATTRKTTTTTEKGKTQLNVSIDR